MSIKLIVAFLTCVSYDAVSLRTETFNFGTQPEARARAERAAEQIKVDFKDQPIKVATSIIEDVYE